MKIINVTREQCIGCGACVAIDPAHFEFDDEGISKVTNNENTDSENLINALESCPTSAITLVEGETCNCGCATCNENNESLDCDCKDCTCGEECSCGCGNDIACNCENECNCSNSCEHNQN